MGVAYCSFLYCREQVRWARNIKSTVCAYFECYQYHKNLSTGSQILEHKVRTQIKLDKKSMFTSIMIRHCHGGELRDILHLYSDRRDTIRHYFFNTQRIFIR